MYFYREVHIWGGVSERYYVSYAAAFFAESNDDMKIVLDELSLG